MRLQDILLLGACVDVQLQLLAGTLRFLQQIRFDPLRIIPSIGNNPRKLFLFLFELLQSLADGIHLALQQWIDPDFQFRTYAGGRADNLSLDEQRRPGQPTDNVAFF